MVRVVDEGVVVGDGDEERNVDNMRDPALPTRNRTRVEIHGALGGKSGGPRCELQSTSRVPFLVLSFIHLPRVHNGQRYVN